MPNNRRGKKPARAFRVTVDYGQSLKEMITAGVYDWVDPKITAKHFRLPGRGRVEIPLTIVSYPLPMTGGQVVGALAEQGLQPARLEHLLAFDAVHAMLYDMCLVALGMMWVDPEGTAQVPYLRDIVIDGEHQTLDLALEPFDREWELSTRFLAMPKESV